MESKSKVYGMVKSFAIAMLVTTGSGGRAESRPMRIAKVAEEGDIWFFIPRNGHVAREVGEDPVVLLDFQDERSAYVSLRGRARIVQDRSRAKELWKESYKVWFPGGTDDPDLALLAVDPISAEYWDSRGTNKLEYVFEPMKAHMQGARSEIDDAGQRGRLSMTGSGST